MPEKLTVLIPCRNERANIRACIESVRPVADEILVADSLSDDDTLAIVRAAGGCRIIEREFIDYSSFKNWALPQASHPWVLALDADERVTPQLAAEIRRVLQNPAETIDGYRILRRNFFMGREVRHSGWGGDYVIRMLRRDRCRFNKVRVHEGIDLPRERTAVLEGALLHYPYWSYRQYLEKFERYSRFGAQDRYDRGGRAGFLRTLLIAPLTFLKYYIIKGGILDGTLGLQLSMLAGYSSFFKEIRLWELEHAVQQPDDAAPHVSVPQVQNIPRPHMALSEKAEPLSKYSSRGA